MKGANAIRRRVGDLALAEWSERLASSGAGVRIGPFDMHLRVPIEALHDPLQRFYRDHPLLEGEHVYSCHADLRRVWHVGRRPGRRIRFSVDGVAPHEDMPVGQGLAVLEWGLNLAIAMRFHGFFMLHAAVLERGGHALLMPASPGRGKTTLCAALAHRGWRLFSDEFGLVRPQERILTPVPRPMPLKNASIEVLQKFAPEAELGPIIPETRKGTIAHVKPPRESIERAQETAPPAWIVFPRWVADAPLALEPVGGADAFMLLVTNAFNYELLGEAAFTAARAIVDQCQHFTLVYSDLAEAVAALTELADSHASQ